MPDYSPAFIVSSLPDYVKENEELISKRVLFGAGSVARFVPQNIQETGKINFLGVSGSFQNGKGCATNYNTNATMTDRSIVTAILERKMKICPDTLLGKWPEYLVRIPADQREVIPFEAYLLNDLIADINEELEELVWMGATATYSGTDLINGIVTILLNEASCIDVSISAGTSAYSAFKQVVAAVPAKLKKGRKNIVVYVAPEFYEALQFEIVDKGNLHLAPSDDPDTFKIGRYTIINTLGLAGEDYLVATTDDNIYLGTSDVNAKDRAKVGFNEEYGYAYMNVRFNAGVNVAFPDWCVLGTLAGDIASPDNESALASIAESAKGVAEVMGDVFNEAKNSINTTATA